MKWVFLMLSFSFFISCDYSTISSESDDFPIHFSIQPNDAKRVAFGDLFTDFEYIFLDESDYIIGNAKDIFFHGDSLLFVFDDLNQAVFKYDFEGNLLGQVLPLGEGPGEYSAIESVSLDQESEEIVVYSSEELKLLRYDYNFNVKNEQKFDLLPDFIKAVGNGNVLAFMNDIDMTGMYGHNLLLLDENLKVKDVFLKIDSRYERISYQFWSHMSKYQDEVNIIQTFRNAVYAFDAENKICYEKYYFDFGKANIDPSVIENKFIETIKPIIEERNLFFVQGFLETDAALFVKIKSFQEQYDVLISKTTQEVKIINGAAPDSTGIFMNPLTTKEDTKFVGFLSSEMMTVINGFYSQNDIRLDILEGWEERNGAAALVCLAKYSN